MAPAERDRRRGRGQTAPSNTLKHVDGQPDRRAASARLLELPPGVPRMTSAFALARLVGCDPTSIGDAPEGG